MINLKPDIEDSFVEYKNAVERKKESPDRNELFSIESQINECYIDYGENFDGNTLEYIVPAEVGKLHKKALLGLYGSNAAIIKQFRQRHFAQNPQTYNNLCPYCTLNEANTTEHILPKEKYPEFAINTLNLIPACSGCNSMKGEQVLNPQNNKKQTINFYTDILPRDQYLYVDFTVVGKSIKSIYRLENVGGVIDSDLFSLIERHFDKFDLLNRFNDKAIQEVSELKSLYLVESFKNEIEYNNFSEKQIRKVCMDRPQLGYNHWKIILYFEAAKSEVFKTYILSLI